MLRSHPSFMRLLTAMLTIVLCASVSACGADEARSEAPVGQTERNETVTAANLAIVTDGEGNGVLVGTMVNNADVSDQLVDARVVGPGGEPVEVRLPRGPVAIPPREPVRLADDPAVLVSSSRLEQGFRAPLTLEFADSAALSTTVTVEPRTDPYADIEIPTPTQ